MNFLMTRVNMTPSFRLPGRTRLICQTMKWLALAATGLIIIFYFTTDAVSAILDAVWAGLQPQVREDVAYSAGKKLLLQTLATISYFSLVLILLGAARVFSVFQTGKVFGPIAVRAVRFLGLMIFLFAAIQLVMPTLMVLGLTFDSGEDRRALTIAVNSMQVVLLLIGGVILIIGQILTQATDIALENEQFV